MHSVLKGAGYVLIHTPDMVIHNGSTQTTERVVNPDSAYLKELPVHLRDYRAAVAYYPNQVYIGNRLPEALGALEGSWSDTPDPEATREGKFGEIMPQEEFYLLMQLCDGFDLVKLDEAFVAAHRAAVETHPLYDDGMRARLAPGVAAEEIARLVSGEHAEGLYHGGKLVGCVKRAHDLDPNLNAHVMHENLVSKASSVLSILHALKVAGVERGAVDYVIDCSEEACGDMNQRGGGNFAKAAAEIAGLMNATGSDTRGFCAAPAHALINAAALVAAGAYETVLVTAGGCTAKLGMNAKDHVRKELPVLEDVLAGFAAVITKDNGIDPRIDLSVLGRHKVGTGSAPQAVITALVSEPLARNGMKILDVDKYSVEMQNPDVTKPAGAGNVPESNYKMIGALAAKSGEMTPKDLPDFIKKHGMTGWAPTQGHIPSGVPYLGFAREAMAKGEISTAMILGKGSLFLGRMTNLFDGVSFLLRAQATQATQGDGSSVLQGTEEPSDCYGTPQEFRNSPPSPQLSFSARGRENPRIALTALGSELPEDELFAGAVEAARGGVDVVYLGTKTDDAMTCLSAADEGAARAEMERLIAGGEVDGAVTMHHPFPIGVSTVGRSVVNGRRLYLATTTGTASTDRVEGMVKSAVYGIAAAKACGVETPTVGILNIDGARSAEGALKALRQNGYPIQFAQSGRADGGCIMRGNDVLAGSCDVLVTDPLTGNVLSKMLAAAATGGLVEDTGDGYGPGIGIGYDRLILILSRASGRGVVAGALNYAGELARGNLLQVAAAELAAAQRAGLDTVLSRRKRGDSSPACLLGTQAAEPSDCYGTPKEFRNSPPSPQLPEAAAPPTEPTTAEIHGIEIMELDDAVQALWKAGIYAASGMGCTGPVVMVNEAREAQARGIMLAAGFLSE